MVDFFAEWCGPCKMMGPVIEDLERDNKTKENLKIGKLNVDESRSVAEKYKIMGIPTTILFKDGKPVGQTVGYQTKEQLQELINQHL